MGRRPWNKVIKQLCTFPIAKLLFKPQEGKHVVCTEQLAKMMLFLNSSIVAVNTEGGEGEENMHQQDAKRLLCHKKIKQLWLEIQSHLVMKETVSSFQRFVKLQYDVIFAINEQNFTVYFNCITLFISLILFSASLFDDGNEEERKALTLSKSLLNWGEALNALEIVSVLQEVIVLF